MNIPAVKARIKSLGKQLVALHKKKDALDAVVDILKDEIEVNEREIDGLETSLVSIKMPLEKREEIKTALEEVFDGEAHVFIDGIDEEDEDSTDDGNAHVRRNGVRFCVGFTNSKGWQDDAKAERNLNKMAKIIDKLLCK